jgi:hypothetical protein
MMSVAPAGANATWDVDPLPADATLMINSGTVLTGTGGFTSITLAHEECSRPVRCRGSGWCLSLYASVKVGYWEKRRASYRHGIARSASTATQLRCWMPLLLLRPSN